jgi:hypothetical protein
MALQSNNSTPMKSDFKPLCPNCTSMRLSPEYAEEYCALMRKQIGFDFRTSAPPLRQCQLCHTHYQDWEVAKGDWGLLPEKYRRMVLCEADFVALLQQSGNDPSTVQITHDSWNDRMASWEVAKDNPGNETNISVDFGVIRESMWCEVLESPSPLTYVTRLCDDSFFDPHLRVGTRLVAKWDGTTVDGITGRPLLHPIGRLTPLPPKPPRRPKKTKK